MAPTPPPVAAGGTYRWTNPRLSWVSASPRLEVPQSTRQPANATCAPGYGTRPPSVIILHVMGLNPAASAALILAVACASPSGETNTTVGPPGGGSRLGPGASLNGRRPFPDDNPWNTPVDRAPVDPISDILIESIGADSTLHPDFGANFNGGPFGIPYIVVAGSTIPVPVTFEYDDESDPGPYPIPPDAPIEGGASSSGDRHVLVVDRDNWLLYELFRAYPDAGGWRAGSGAIFDLASNALRPAGWTSADAAGLPVFPGLVRYDEVVERGEIRHAVRFTARRTRRGYIGPARHFASSDTSSARPPMGMRVRLRAGVDISGYPPSARVVLQALKTYGMILADNGGNWFISGTPDPRWDDSELNTLKRLRGRDFEVVTMGPVTTD